jgi:metal-responsive CopG/Arc/MetJ family transcriptional regulator
MKTAVSIPDDVFEAADELARREGRTRSDVYAAALRKYVADHHQAEITEALDRVAAVIGDEPDLWVDATSSAIFRAVEW